MQTVVAVIMELAFVIMDMKCTMENVQRSAIKIVELENVWRINACAHNIIDWRTQLVCQFVPLRTIMIVSMQIVLLHKFAGATRVLNF